MVQYDDIYVKLSKFLASPCIIPSPTRAAVSIILRDPIDENGNVICEYDHQGKLSSLPQVLFIQRAPNPNDRWSAHIAFPGGRQDASDAFDIDTAIRETREEIGLNLDNSKTYEFIGRLNDRPINNRRSYVLSAFVFRQLRNNDDGQDISSTESNKEADKNTIIQPSKIQYEEVSSTFWVSLDYLHHESPTTTYHIHNRHYLSQNKRLYTRMKYMVFKVLGLSVMRMPAVDVLNDSIAVGRVYAERELLQAPHVMLWGLTLQCIGDTVEAVGLRRIDWPGAMPKSWILGGFVWAFAEIWYRLSKFFQTP